MEPKTEVETETGEAEMETGEARRKISGKEPKYDAQTSRLWLQQLTAEKHLEGYHELYSEPGGMAWSTQSPRLTLADSREALTSRLRSDNQPWIELHAILLRPESNYEAADGILRSEAKVKPKLIGVVGAIRQSEPPACVPEIGYRLHPAWRGKGVATEAVRAFLELYWTLEERKNVKQLAAHVDVRNTASSSVMRKVGGRIVGKMTLDLPRLGNCEMEKWILDRPVADKDVKIIY